MFCIISCFTSSSFIALSICVWQHITLRPSSLPKHKETLTNSLKRTYLFFSISLFFFLNLSHCHLHLFVWGIHTYLQYSFFLLLCLLFVVLLFSSLLFCSFSHSFYTWIDGSLDWIGTHFFFYLILTFEEKFY